MVERTTRFDQPPPHAPIWTPGRPGVDARAALDALDDLCLPVRALQPARAQWPRRQRAQLTQTMSPSLPPGASWSDNGPTVTVRVPLGDGDAAAVAVDASGPFTVRVGDAPPLLSLELFSTVDVPAVKWSIDANTVVVTLTKLAAGEWPALAADAAAAPAAEPGAASALEERAKVAALLEAARGGDLDALKTAAAAFGGGAAKVKDGRGRSALHFAATGHPDAVAWLVDEAGAKVDALDDEGETPLSVAAAGGEVPALTALLARGADPALAGPGGAPPLCRAAASGCAAAVEALMAAGADANAESAAGPPLLWAAGGGGSAAVKALLNAGAKADAVADGGVTALLLAAATGKKVQRRLFRILPSNNH